MNIEKKIASVMNSVSQAAEKSGRDPSAIRLVAACKNVGKDKIRQAVEAGVTLLGESYIQEAKDKIKTMAGVAAKWHFIGHLQTNKAKTAVDLFDLIHTVDSFRLARELNRHAAEINKIQRILIQVNISGEKTKSGADAGEIFNLIADIAGLDHIAVKGLMTMPPFFDDPEHTRPYYQALYALSRRILDAAITGVGIDELSMGMSNDYRIAVEEGATLIRVGTFIFGERT